MTSWRKTLHIRDHLPNVPFDHKHDTRFSPSVLSVAVDGPPVTHATGEQDICPCSLSLPLPFFLSKGKASLCTRLYQLCTHLRVKIVVPCISKKSKRIQFGCFEHCNIAQSNIRRKRIVLLVVVVTRSFFSVIASKINWVTVGLIGFCGFIHVFIILIIVIYNGSEVRVIGTCSRFSAATVFTFAFSAKPTSA